MRQIKIKKVVGKIYVKTGLHVGAGNDKVEIGGMDNPIIKNPINREPYIPGSSIKGKLRSAIEWNTGIVAKTGGSVCSCGSEQCPVCRVFGSANTKSEGSKDRGPTRLIVRDAVLTKEWSEKFAKGVSILEDKSENTIDRIQGVASNPRHIERVAPGVEFDFEISYRVIDTGDGGKLDEDNFKEVVLKGLKILENDYLGGGGTRGNGQIEFKDLQDENGNKIEL